MCTKRRIIHSISAAVVVVQGTSLVPRALCVLSLLVLPLIAGCLNPMGDVERPDGDSPTVGVLTERGTQLIHLTTWPADKTAMEVIVDCVCPGENVLLGWKFLANWTPAPASVDTPQQTQVRNQVDVDLYAAMLLRDLELPRQSPPAHVDVLRSGIIAIGTPGTYTTMVGTGLAPSVELSMPTGNTGNASVAYNQEFPLEVEMDEHPIRLVFVATNETGYRTMPEFNLTLELPINASLRLRTGATSAFAYDEPLLEQVVGLAVDQNYPRHANLRIFGESSLEWETQGELLYTFLPWVRPEGLQDATYRIDAPDHMYRARVNYTNGQGGYQCLEGCDGLGGTYAINAGLAPPGPIRFTIEGATCATDSGCYGIMVGVDLGSLTAQSFTTAEKTE